MGSSRNLTLYVDLLSQPCRAVTIFCRVNEIEADVQIVSLWKKETREPPFLAINPLGQLPAIDDGGFTLSESHTIMRYLAATRKVADHWYPEDLEKRACVDRVLDWHFGNLHRDVAQFLVHRELAPLLGRTKNPTSAAEAEDSLKQSLKTMETVWLKDSPFLAGGSQPSIADISSACQLQQLKLLDKEEPGALLAPYEKVKAWMVAVEEFTAPYFVDAQGVLEKLAKIFEDRRKSEAEAEVETAPKV
ncbi:hypothetical protein BDL97_14G004300 [Sphagnum fallax]|nr:hypothetical protein BDL97_14G004300 [Sphagnum fallax]KAH8940812.1 hypothetical protein BDL97_14G004300 [Sphagnum fallax]